MSTFTTIKKALAVLSISFLLAPSALLYPQATYAQNVPTPTAADAAKAVATSACAAANINEYLSKGVAALGKALGFGGGGGEDNNVPVGDASTRKSTEGTRTETGKFSFMECIWKPLIKQMASKMLHNIAADTVNWINGGFHGNPSFVRNFKGFMIDTTDQVVGNFIQNDLKGSFLCNAFSYHVKIALAQGYLPYAQRSSCTLKQIANNVNGFVQSDNSGGWENFLQITSVPQNNPYGSYALAEQELSKQVAQGRQDLTTELNWGSGFQSWKVCIKTTDGKTGKDIPANIDPYDKSKCAETDSQTPGGVIEKQLNNVLWQPLQQIGVGEDLNQILNALENQILSKSITAAKGLFASDNKQTSSRDYSGSGALVANLQQTDPNAYAFINSGVQAGIDDNGRLGDMLAIDAGLSVDLGTSTPVVATTTPSGATSTPQALGLVVVTPSPIMTDASGLAYEIDVASNQSVSNLRVMMVTKKQGAPVAFSSVLGSPRIGYSRTDGSIAFTDIGSGLATADFTNVSVSQTGKFVLRLSGSKLPGETGSYIIETTLFDNFGNILTKESTSVIVQ